VDDRLLTDLEIVTADGGAGGDGAGLVVPVPVVHIDDNAKIQLRWLDTTTFCEKYGLGDEICQRLIGEKYHRINSLFEEDETQLKELHLEVGHIAELKWAMKKMLLEEYPDIELTYTKGEYAPQIYGTEPTIVRKFHLKLLQEGQEVLAEAVLEVALVGLAWRLRLGSNISIALVKSAVSLFVVTLAHCLILPGGGTGGLGGAGSVEGSVEKPNVVATGVNTDPTPQRIVNIDGMIGTSEPPEVVAAGVNTGPAPQRILIGMCSFIWGWILHIEILQVDKEKPVDRVLWVALVALVGRRKSLYHMFLSSVKLLVRWSPFTLGC
jgi:hypothetical protein